MTHSCYWYQRQAVIYILLIAAIIIKLVLFKPEKWNFKWWEPLQNRKKGETFKNHVSVLIVLTGVWMSSTSSSYSLKMIFFPPKIGVLMTCSVRFWASMSLLNLSMSIYLIFLLSITRFWDLNFLLSGWKITLSMSHAVHIKCWNFVNIPKTN